MHAVVYIHIYTTGLHLLLLSDNVDVGV